MKVWLDSNYNIVKDDGCNKFTKGNNLYDRISVYVPIESMANDNTLPRFIFLLANGRKYGPLVHNTNPTDEVVDGIEYKVITYALTDNLLSCKGVLEITITINWYSDENKVLKSKNINLVGNVIDSVVVNDDIIIAGNEDGIVRSLVEDVDSLNTRLGELETFDIKEVNATIDNSVGTPSVEVVESGNKNHPTYSFNFYNLKGEQGIQGPQGIQGEIGSPFRISKIYPSVEAMQEGYATDGLEIGEMVVIQSDVSDDENARVYVKGNQQYNFIVDMSGARGIQGPVGPQGPQGETGVVTPIQTGFFTLTVDEATGDLFLIHDSADTAPTFEYDEETGNLYYIQEVEDESDGNN